MIYMKILGISPEHDSSTCLLEDGIIKYFMKEERITRVKRDHYPVRTVSELVKDNDIDYIAWCSPSKNDGTFINFSKECFRDKSFKDIFNFSDKHHLTHASLAFYNSGFNKAAVIVVDRNGSKLHNSCRESESVFIASYPCVFEEVYKSFWIVDNSAYEDIANLRKDKPHCEIECRSMFGVVKTYETATSLIGQNALENGKTMGLAAYGDKDTDYPNLFSKDNIPTDYLFGHDLLHGNRMAVHQDLHQFRTLNVDKDNYKLYADYAWQVQKQTQEAVCKLIEKTIKRTGFKKICITGGYGLNVVANHFYTTRFPDVEFYFEPLADDSGNSIGGAMYVHRYVTQDPIIRPLKHTFFNGVNYSLDDIDGEKVSVADIANILSKGKSVAVYKGLSEAGPRALGNRSILFNPTLLDARDIVNKIKNREWYRPFAAMVLEEDAHKYFEMGNLKSNKFMTVSFAANQYAINNIYGVLHVDNTCRIQTISEEDGVVFELLNEFKKITGHGVLLNTSFNIAGEPLVETPEDAVNTLRNSPLDYVWFPEKNCVVN